MEPKSLATPDITAAQLVAAVSAVVGLFVSQHYIDNNLGQLLSGIASIVVPVIWVAADAVIRHGRARAFTVPPKGIVADDEAPAAPKARARRTRS